MRRYNVISADTHLEISPEQWTGRLPASLRDRGPRVVELTAGDLPPGLPVMGEGWIVEGVDKVVPLGMNLAAGKAPDQRRTRAARACPVTTSGMPSKFTSPAAARP